MFRKKFVLSRFVSTLSVSAAALACACFAGTELFAAGVSVKTGVWPVMARMDYNPVMQIVLTAPGGKPELKELTLNFSRTTNPDDIAGVDVYVGGNAAGAGKKFATALLSKENPSVTLAGTASLAPSKENAVWVSVRVKDDADLDGKISVSVSGVKLSGGAALKADPAVATQRIGYCVAKAGELGSQFYRIPALARSPKTGTLVATYDIRYKTWVDLPNPIDIGVSRSTDGGKSWTPPTVAATSKGLGYGNGIGDPGILADNKGTFWIAGLMAGKSGKNPINDPATTDPDACGQFMVFNSTDDGKTWSKPKNFTASVKRGGGKNWGTVFQGPGAGICTKKGVLVFPGQVWQNRKPVCGVLIYSKDGGKTWKSSKAMTWGGSESTCVQLRDGSIMLNVRQGTPEARVVATTKNLGEKWTKFDKGRPLNQPKSLCQGALLTANGNELYFSNPLGFAARDQLSIRYSKDGGKTWTGGLRFEDRTTGGYSSLAFADKENDTIGVLYEGSPVNKAICFLRIPCSEIKKAPK